MQVSATRPATAPARRARLRTAFPPAMPPVRLPQRVALGDFSRAEGPWEIDWMRARADAEAALAAIDFSRPEIMMWIPGTDGKGVHHDFQLAADYLYGARPTGLSLTALPYEASWSLRRSLPTGLATMKLLLHGIKERFAQIEAAGRPRPKLLLAGLSQGAWIIGEAMADPELTGLVTRAITVGHPWMARHQYGDGHEPRVRVIGHVGDQITMEVAGSVGTGLDAMIAVRTGQIGKGLGSVVRAILANPLHGVLLLQNQLRNLGWLRPYLSDPHEYSMEMPRMVRYLRDGVLDASNEELDAARKARRATT
ncbi:MAG: hypothetical protein JWM86_1819 [Thermoleophilia bacterium]|nr:hypothetical protein [Thermoleophilia bacterium]